MKNGFYVKKENYLGVYLIIYFPVSTIIFNWYTKIIHINGVHTMFQYVHILCGQIKHVYHFKHLSLLYGKNIQILSSNFLRSTAQNQYLSHTTVQ
jgi:hypothetical protein